MTKFFGCSLVLVCLGAAGCNFFGGGSEVTEEYSADLDGAQETPPAETEGFGDATLTRQGNVLEFEITASGLTGPLTAAHFHEGVVGVAGPVVFNLTDLIDEEDGEITIQGEWTLSDAEIESLDSDILYINLHTAQFPDGEIRGQVELRDLQ